MLFSKKQENLTGKSQQELMIMLVESQLKSEKFMERILNNVLFYFYIGIFGFIFYIFSSIR
jgi:hypothetical protein